MLLRIYCIISLISAVIMTGCSLTLPPQYFKSDSYSLNDTKTFSLDVNCDKAKVKSIDDDFYKSYCNDLSDHIFKAISRKHAVWTDTKNNPDLQISVQLEELYGGSALARFIFDPLGPGRSATTVLVKVLKNRELQAEARIIETTITSNILIGRVTNEQVISADSLLIAKKTSEFINNPDEFK